MIDIEKRNGLWWPKADVHCFPAAMKEVEDVHQIVSHCTGMRRCVVQAGGNAGVWPLEFAKYFDLVLTFEPDLQNYSCLAANTLGNKRIKAMQAGLGDTNERVNLAREADNSGAYYVEGAGDIKIITLDSLDIPDCDLLQLDIEGYEYKALQGAWETIKRCRPVIVCEEKGLGSRYGEERDAISSLLSGLNYKVADKVSNDVIYTYRSK